MALSSDVAALNSMIYSYAALSTGAQVVGQQTLWTERRIQLVVNDKYISGRLKSDARSQLNQPLSFGDGLTNDTYVDFILQRAKRLFLALCEVGKQECIFRAIDLAYDDGDLPLTEETIMDLGLAAKEDDKINRRFQTIQHRFLLRELEQGDHVDFDPEQTVPVEYVYQAAATPSLQNWIRLRVPGRSGELMARRSLVTLPFDNGDKPPTTLLDDLETARTIQHDHVTSVWATYTYEGVAYAITPVVAEYTLQSFLEAKYVAHYSKLPRQNRHRILLRWMHCLADTLAYLHSKNIAMSTIKPSSIVIDSTNRIAFADIGCFETFRYDGPVDPDEVYKYSAPETQEIQSVPDIASPPTTFSKGGIASQLLRRRGSRKRSTSHGHSHQHSNDNRDFTNVTPGQTNPDPPRAEFLSRQHLDFTSSHPFDNLQRSSQDQYSVTSSNTSFASTRKADIFSLGCIFVDILSHMHKYRPSDIAKHIRSARGGSKDPKATKSRTQISFHNNMPRINTWLDVLQDTALRNDDPTDRAVPYLLHTIRSMLCPSPEMRPSAAKLQERLKDILEQYASIEKKDMHCGHVPHTWDSGSSGSSHHPMVALSSRPAGTLRHSGHFLASPARGISHAKEPSSASESLQDRPRSKSKASKQRAPLQMDFDAKMAWPTFR